VSKSIDVKSFMAGLLIGAALTAMIALAIMVVTLRQRPPAAASTLPARHSEPPGARTQAWTRPAPAAPLKHEAASPEPALLPTLSAHEQLEAILSADATKEERGPMKIKALHKQLLEEAPDPDWTPEVTVDLRDYLNGNIDSSMVQIAQIQCGASLCEIQAAAASPDTDPNDAIEAFSAALRQMHNQPWSTQYGVVEGGYMAPTGANGQTLLLSFVMRKPSGNAQKLAQR
jgi:hypothetical protein